MRHALIPDHARRWTLGLYALALLLFLQPFVEAASAVWPFRFSEVGWRFATVGILYTMLPTLLFALLVLAIAAFLLGHRTVLQIAGVIALILAVVVILLTSGFTLDALQLRRIVRPEAKGGYDLATIKTVMTALIAVAACTVLGVGAFRTTQRLGTAGAPRRREAGAGLLVGQREQRPPV